MEEVGRNESLSVICESPSSVIYDNPSALYESPSVICGSPSSVAYESLSATHESPSVIYERQSGLWWSSSALRMKQTNTQQPGFYSSISCICPDLGTEIADHEREDFKLALKACREKRLGHVSSSADVRYEI